MKTRLYRRRIEDRRRGVLGRTICGASAGARRSRSEVYPLAAGLAPALTWHLPFAQLPTVEKAAPPARWQDPQDFLAASAGLCIPALKFSGALACGNSTS